MVLDHGPGRHNQGEAFPASNVLASVKRDFSERKGKNSKSWARKMLARTNNRKYRPCEKQKPDQTVAQTNKRLASRFYQLKTGHCLTGQYLAWTTRSLDATCWWCQYKNQTREHLLKNCPQWKHQQKTLWATVITETRKIPGPTRGRDRTQIAELFADERCSQAALAFLATTDVGRTGVSPEEGIGDGEASEASGWEARERAERVEMWRQEEELLGED